MQSLFKTLPEAYLYLQTSVCFLLSVAYNSDALQLCQRSGPECKKKKKKKFSSGRNDQENVGFNSVDTYAKMYPEVEEINRVGYQRCSRTWKSIEV